MVDGSAKMNDQCLHRDSDSPPWGSHREALTEAERTRLLLLLLVCLASDLALAYGLARALAA